jgi:hypothetical protein
MEDLSRNVPPTSPPPARVPTMWPTTRPGFPVALVALLLLPASVAGQVYTGTWETTNNAGGTTVVTLQQTGERVSGTLSGNGTTATLQGVLEEGLVVGAVTGGPIESRLWFEAELEDEGLALTLISSLPDGSPNYDEMTTLLFERRTAGGGAGAATGGGAAGAAAGAAAAAVGGADPWVGIFSDGSVTVDLQGSGGRYTGTVRVAGQEFPLAVSGGSSELSGAFRTAEGEFPVTLRRTGTEMVLTTGGVSYPLRVAGTAAAPTNPLAPAPRPAAPAQPAQGEGGGGGIHDGTPLAQEWVQHLAGKMATRRSSSVSTGPGGVDGGMSSRTDVHLCPSGEFAFQGRSRLSLDVGGVAGNSRGDSQGAGRWRILTQGNVAGIELRYNDGSVELYRLDYQNGQTLVDGQRWLVVPSEVCGY